MQSRFGEQYDAPGSFVKLRVRSEGAITTEYINESFAEKRGMSVDEILALEGKDALCLVHPDDKQLVRAVIEEIISTGEARRMQCRLMHSGGDYLPFTVFAHAKTGEAGDSYVYAYYAELSEHEKQERSLREMMPYVLSAITEHATDLVFAKDRDFKYICCSPAFVKFTRQKSQSDVIGRTDYDFFTKEEADHFRGDDERLYRDGVPLIDYVEPIPSDDGIQHYSSTSKYVLRDTSGAIIGMYGIGRDITEYRTTFDRLKLLADSISGGLVTYALTKQGMRMIYFNDGLCRMLGCTREEYERASKHGVITSIFDEDIPALDAQMNALIEHGTPVNCTCRAHNIKGEGYKWVNLRVATVEKQGDSLIANAVIYDVTEQKLAEESARIHAQEMIVAMSQLGRMICEYDIAKDTLAMPESYAQSHGVPAVIQGVRAQLNAGQGAQFEYLSNFTEFYMRMMSGERTGAVEYQGSRVDNTHNWERAEFSTIFESGGMPVKAVITIEDTTQQHVQYELERNRPTLAEDNLIVYALINLTTRETLDYAYYDGTEVPVSARTLFTEGGASVDTLIINADERARYRDMHDPDKLLARYANGEKELSLDYRRLSPDGEIVWVRNILRMVRKPGGDDVLLFVYFYDIEEEKTQELMYGALVNESYDYVARVNTRNKHFVIIANVGVQYGMPPKRGDDIDEVARDIADNFIHPDDREMVLSNSCVKGMRANLATQARFQFTFRMLRPDGTMRYKKLTQFYLDREREIVVITREDVSSAVQAEMHKNEQLSNALIAANQASQAKTQFLSRMSHELRTPMNAIIGLSALSAMEVNNPKAMEDSIGKIGMSARYLLSLINDILEMSRIESGKLTLAEAQFDFEKLIAEVNSIIFAQAEAKGLDYDAIVSSYTEPSYIGDETKLQEILINVLGNAVKFTPPGGKVTLAIEQIKRQKSRAMLRFTITDTGIGIDEGFMPYLFNPFAQEATNYTSTSTGTGLGLAITKNIVEMMSGQIQVKSIKNIGSVFTIDVQLGVPKENQRYNDILAQMNLERIRALVVDDDIVVCKSTEGILRSMGIKAEWAESGHGAIARVKAARDESRDFDTIFIDWKMPDMNGIETTREIRKIVGADVTIIIMTAYDWRAIEAEAREAGVDLFMEKPLFQSSIVKAFERVFTATKEKVQPTPPEKPDFTGVRVLLAEDHPLNVEVARRLLEKVNAEVVVAGNGLEALETFATSDDGYFDAILMDIRMPVMDGLTATKNIRKLRKMGSRDIPIIAMTANAFDEDVELSMYSGMNAHLAKPIEPQLMYATLKRLIKADT